jgi:hypothetical protein
MRDPDAAGVASPPLFMAFDLLHHDRRDLTAQPLRDRRARLEDLVANNDLVFPVRRLAADGLEAWAQVVEHDYEPAGRQSRAGVRLLVLICAERTRPAGRFQSSSAPRVLLSPPGSATRTRAGTGGCTELRRKTEGRFVTGPRLLIRKSLVRDQPGEPTFNAYFYNAASRWFEAGVTHGATLSQPEICAASRSPDRPGPAATAGS